MLCLKATIENPRGSVEKLSPKGCVKGANTVLRSSVRAPEEFSEGKPEAAAEENPEGALTLPCRIVLHPRHSHEGTVIPLRPKDFHQLLRLPIS